MEYSCPTSGTICASVADKDAGRLQFFKGGWLMDYPDPEGILDLNFHSASQVNDLGYENALVDALLEEARLEQDVERRLDLYRQAELTIVSDVAWLPLYFGRSHIVVRESVHGWFNPPIVMPRLRFITVDPR